MIKAICSVYGIGVSALIEPGKKQPAGEARAVAALVVQEADGISLTELARYAKRDLASRSKAARRICERSKGNPELRGRLVKISNLLKQMPKSQA